MTLVARHDDANALSQATVRTYDDAGRLATERDPRNYTTVFGYDPVGRLKTIRDALGATVTLGYNLAGEQTGITDARNKTWQTTYDVLGGVKVETDPLGNAADLTVYNRAGQLTSSTDARGISLTYTYDDVGNLPLDGVTGTERRVHVRQPQPASDDDRSDRRLDLDVRRCRPDDVIGIDVWIGQLLL